MNAGDVDLNLMRVFDALFAARSVSRAAARLGLSQPAMSNALARLRRLFGDELFVRQGRLMVPTQRAEAIAPLARQVMQSTEEAVNAALPFEPASSTRSLRVSAGDYVLKLVAGELARRLQRLAPGIDLRLRFVEKDRVLDLLDDGSLDLALGVFPDPPKRVLAEPLFVERFVGLARPGHPALKPRLAPAEFAAYEHVLVTERGDQQGAVDTALAAAGLRRRVALAVPQVSLLPELLAVGDRVASTGERVARLLARQHGLATFELPLALPPWCMSSLRSRRRSRDPAPAWLAARIREVAGGV